MAAPPPEERPAATAYTVRHAVCPSCGIPLENAVLPRPPDGLAPGPPGHGDLTICAHCRALLCWRADMTLRLFRRAEYARLAPEEKQIVRRYQAMLYAGMGCGERPQPPRPPRH